MANLGNGIGDLYICYLSDGDSCHMKLNPTLRFTYSLLSHAVDRQALLLECDNRIIGDHGRQSRSKRK